MGRDRVIELAHAEATEALGEELAASLGPNSLLALSGELGAGKTTLVKGLARALGILEPILSPTFVYLNAYEGGNLPLFHFDLYRLKKASDFIALGFDEYLERGGIAAIEWPERIASLLPPSTLFLRLVQCGGRRKAQLSEKGLLPIQ